ncbi:hypothetical protein Tco_1406342 [Tanacetum coccineum]
MKSISDEISKTIKLEDLSKLMQDVKTKSMDLDSLEDEPIFVQDENEEEEKEETYEDTHATSHKETLYNFIPSKLKELPSNITILSGEVKELKKHVQGMEFELSGDLKEIPNKLETFTSTVSNLTSQIIKKDKGKEAMSSKDAVEEETESDSENDYANPVDSIVESSKENKLKKFYFVTKGEVEKVKNELADLMGIDVVTKYYKDKLLYDKYYDKMMNRRKSSKITNCDVLTRRGPITLKVYREDGANKKRKKVDDFHDYFKSTKKFKPSVQYEDHPADQHAHTFLYLESYQTVYLGMLLLAYFNTSRKIFEYQISERLE